MKTPGRERGYLARIMVLCTLPHSDQGGGEMIRRSGRTMLSMHNRSSIGLPYGRYGRLLLAWVTTEALRRECPDLELGPSFDVFMDRVGIVSQAGGKRAVRAALRDQMKRLFTATIAVTAGASEHWHDHGQRVAEHVDLWWNPEHNGRPGEWSSRIRLSREFYESVIERPVPIDLRILRHLRSSFAIDVYAWLCHRLRDLPRPVLVPWDQLEAHFGHGYGRRRDFKRRFAHYLETVKRWHPVPAIPTRDGLELGP